MNWLKKICDQEFYAKCKSEIEEYIEKEWQADLERCEDQKKQDGFRRHMKD